MADRAREDGPILAQPMLATSPLGAAPLALSGLGVVVAAAAAIWLTSLGQYAVENSIPASPADLSDTVVTEIDASNGAAIASALSMLRLSAAQRQKVAQEVAQRERRLGWIVLIDSVDPDGDTVAVDSAGLTQQVLLSKAWVPVVVPISSGPIGITAIRDGDSGGITVALATRRGPLALRALLPGERIEVMP